MPDPDAPYSQRVSRWADAGGSGRYPDIEVRNYAVDLGLATEAA